MSSTPKITIIVIALFSSLLSLTNARGASAKPDPIYREFISRLRNKGRFRVPMPSGVDMSYYFEMTPGKPLYQVPIVSDYLLGPVNGPFIRNFWDKVLLEDSSFVQIGEDKIPLTCVFIRGQDNRFSRKGGPLLPDYVLKVFLIANDYTCTGPINPGWPENGGKKETWDTYLYYEIKDPTIMLPTEAKVRYRWNEFGAVVVDPGQGNQ